MSSTEIPTQLQPRVICEYRREGYNVTVMYEGGATEQFDLRKEDQFERADYLRVQFIGEKIKL